MSEFTEKLRAFAVLARVSKDAIERAEWLEQRFGTLKLVFTKFMMTMEQLFVAPPECVSYVKAMSQLLFTHGLQRGYFGGTLSAQAARGSPRVCLDLAFDGPGHVQRAGKRCPELHRHHGVLSALCGSPSGEHNASRIPGRRYVTHTHTPHHHTITQST
jgi:hypothetical protein